MSVKARTLTSFSEPKTMANSVVWVDIPVVELDRAIRFYSGVLGREVQKQEYPGMAIGLLPGL